MSQASLIINVSDQDHLHSNGLSGTWIAQGRKPGEPFSLLVVYPTPEIQDIGDERKTVHWLKSRPLALDIIGARSDASAHSMGASGGKEKWGLLLCEAEPDLPKELLEAQEKEMEYLNLHPPDVKMRTDPATKATVATNLYNSEPGEFDRRVELSMTVQMLREDFVKYCRTLVTKEEVLRAKANLLKEDQRLVGEGDLMWARPAQQQNINEPHRKAAERLGLQKPWHYQPMQLLPCPGCGTMIQENILKCPACVGWLDEGIERLGAMDPKERRAKMYPEQFERDPVSVAGPGKGK